MRRRNVAFWLLWLCALCAGQTKKAEPKAVQIDDCGDSYAAIPSPDRYIVTDRLNPFYYVSASTKKGVGGEVLVFAMRLKDQNGNRSSVLRGTEEFDRMIKHFPNIDGIEGSWDTLYVGTASDNLVQFNQATAPPNGLSLEKAALETWTGRQAARHGFTRVFVKEVSGSAGDYDYVNVEFLKPQ